MHIQFKNQYTSKKQQLRYAYTVHGTKAELEAFKKARGNYYVEDEKGNPVWTTGFLATGTELIVTKEGKITVDNSEIRNLNALIAQNPGPVGEHLAKAQAEKLLGVLKSMSKSTPVATVATADTTANQD